MDNNSFDIKKYLITILLSTFVVFTIYIFEIEVMQTHKGLVMGAVDVLLEFFVFYKLFKLEKTNSEIKNLPLLKWVFLFLGFGDLFYIALYYGLQIPPRGILAGIITTLTYSVAYFIGALSLILLSENPKNWLKNKYNYIALLLCLPVALKLLLIPFFNLNTDFSLYFFSLEIISIAGTMVLLANALVTLISSRVIFWSNFSIGIVILVISDWALRVEELIDNKPKFGYYEALYCFGIIVIALPFFHIKTISKIENYNRNSIVSKIKVVTLTSVFLSVIFLSLSQYGTRDSIRFASIGCIVGAFLATVLSFYLIQEIARFSNRINFITTSSDARFIGLSNSDIHPIELHDIYNDTVAAQINAVKEKIRANETIALTTLASQVAHDIRAPISALKMSTSVFKNLSEKENLTGSELSIGLEIMTTACDQIYSVAQKLLKERKMGLYKSKETVQDAIESAVRIVAITNPEVSIRREISDGSQVLSIPGLTVVLTNLLKNAAEASKVDGEVKILGYKQGERFEIRILDKGSGIPQEVLNEIKKGSAVTTKKDGNGMGLSSTFSWASINNVIFEIMSSETNGTEVKIII